MLRAELGMSQVALGDKLGIDVQQVENYERGTNRINVSMLFDIAHALGVSIEYFFRDLPGGASHDTTPRWLV